MGEGREGGVDNFDRVRQGAAYRERRESSAGEWVKVSVSGVPDDGADGL